MSDQRPRNPDVDFGFRAQIPRLVRTGFRDLTPVQKWLYTCLKDLCGDHGTCYRTIKVLSEETGISTGMLSESIPILHSHGLIHGEKKKRHTGGKEVWHITIVDIWQANAKAHPTKRSHSEQTLAANVHTVNENVHSVNDTPLKRSAGEYKRSLCETEGLPVSNNSNEALPVEESVKPRTRILMSPEEEKSLAETIGHDFSRNHPVTNCRDWQGAHHGTCTDYQAWIERGGRNEPTEPRLKSVKIGATDASVASASPDFRPGDAGGGDRVLAPLQDRGLARRDGVALARAARKDTLQTEQAAQTAPAVPLAIASTSGEPDTSPLSAQTRQSQTTTLQGPGDGAAIALEGSEPRASSVTWESILDDWAAVQGRPQSRTDRMCKAAREGVAANPTREEMKGCRDWLPTTDNPNKPYYRRKGVGLWDVIDRMDEYRSYLALSIEPAPLADVKQPKPMDIYTAASLDKERNARRVEEMKANAARKGLHLHGTQQGGT